MTFDASTEIPQEVPTHSERGRMGGAPITTGSVKTSYGGVLASVHVARLRKIAATETGRRKEHLLAAVECIQALARKNRRLGAQVGATAKRKLLTHRGVMLSGKPEDIAADIAELAGDQTVTAYLYARGRVRVTTQEQLVGPAENRRIGRYDAQCDYRDVLADVIEALGQS